MISRFREHKYKYLTTIVKHEDHASTWYDYGDSYLSWYDHGLIIMDSAWSCQGDMMQTYLKFEW